MAVKILSKSKAWIAEFLFVRNIMSGPVACPLHKYQVTDEEYAKLPAAIRQSIVDAKDPHYSQYWSAMFCLFVSEKYRREYDGSNLGWSWRGFEEPLSINLPSQFHREVVRKGMNFWKRPIRKRANGYDYLGSLFDEGGVPWRLIQSDTHGFGRAVRSGVANYYKTKQLGGGVVSVISNYAHYFPQTFRTNDKYILIASIVEWLMSLAESYPISTVESPVDYLDENASDWKNQSPLPLSKNNARTLINEWLKDAGRSRAEKKQLEADEKNYSSEHWLKGNYQRWSIETAVFLPSEIEIDIEDCNIRSTRLEIAFYEGDVLLKRSGIVHGKVNEDRSKISVKINSRAIPVVRSRPELPLTVQFLSNGHRIHSCYFEGSEIDYISLPIVFTKVSGQLKLVSTASITLSASHAVIRTPSMLEPDGVGYKMLGEDEFGGKWLCVSKETTLIGGGSKVVVSFGPNVAQEKLTLTGAVALYDTLPNLVYRGWPSVKTQGCREAQEYHFFANGTPIKLNRQINQIGCFTLSALGAVGETVLKRKIGVLPRDLRVMSVPASMNSSARVILRSSRKLNVRVLDEGLRAEVQEIADGHIITMEPQARRQIPERIRVALFDGINPGEPVILRLPFPQIGVMLFDDEGNVVDGGLVSLDQLIGMSMTLTPRPETKEQFFICLELICHSLPGFRRYYPFTVNGQAQKISLYAFQEDIQQMLGTTSNQDAFVRIRVETDQVLKQLDIVRYNARLEGPTPEGRLEVFADVSGSSEVFFSVSGMRLDDPQTVPVDVPERVSQGVGTGVFEIPKEMMKNGPWLLFSPAESSVKFRPTVWGTGSADKLSQAEAKTLHLAAKQFHPTNNPSVFDNVIAAMAEDLSHVGWDYLRNLKENHGSLPLSAFESWKALANNTSAIAAAVFRLEFGPVFCRRLSNELAVIWETVNVQTWIRVRSAQRAFLIDQGIPEEFAEKLVEDRVSSVTGSIPCFMYLKDYLREPKHVNLQQAPYLFASMCFQDLRRNHADDQRWPEWFSAELTNWVHQQDLPAEIKTLPDVRFSRSVAYLPVFMAAVTSGKASFTDLTISLPELRFAVRVLSDFDREAWYEPTYSLLLSNILLESEE